MSVLDLAPPRAAAAEPDVSAPVAAPDTGGRGGATGAVWLSSVIALVLAGAAPAWVIAAQPNTAGRAVWIPAVAVMVWSGVRLAGIISAERPPLFQFAFHTYCYAYLGLAPLVQLRAGQFPVTSPLVEAGNVVVIWWLVGIGIASYEAGVFLARRRMANRPDTIGPPRAATVELSRGRTTALVLAGIMLSVAFAAVVGPATLFSSREDVQRALDSAFADTSLSALLLAIGSGPLLVGVHALFRVRRHNAAAGLARGKLPLLIVAVLVLLFVVNPVTASRYTAGTLALSFVVLAGGLGGAVRRRVVLLGVLFSFVFLLPSLALSRYSADNLYTGPTGDGFLGNIAFSGDWDTFASIGNAVHYVQVHGATMGSQFLGSIGFFVPRSVWPAKPVDTGILLADDRGYSMTNLSAPLWAEAYVNGGMAVVVAVFLVYGAFSVWASTRTWQALTTQGPWAVGGAIFAWYSFILLRGSLLQATGGAVLMIACLLFVTRRVRPPEPDPTPGEQP